MFLEPLTEFYERSAQNWPGIIRVKSASLPEPYHRLLVHNGDMTATLENFHGQRIHLNVLEQVCTDREMLRKVVLVTEDSEKSVEFGGIKISLSLFDPEPRKHIIEGNLPLGTILKRYAVVYVNRPQIFFKVLSDSVAHDALNLTSSEKLYGRQNLILTPDHKVLAKVVEILAPSETSGTGSNTTGES